MLELVSQSFVLGGMLIMFPSLPCFTPIYHSPLPAHFFGALRSPNQLEGLGSAVSSPSGSERSPADRRFLVHFELKIKLTLP